MKARRSYESTRTPDLITIIRQDWYGQMIAYLSGLPERAALAAEREGAKAKARTKTKKGKKHAARKT